MKFNFSNKAKTVTNYEGATAFALTKEMELYTAVATAGLNDQFYEKEADKLQRIRTLVAKNDPAFVARLAVYARERMHLRSIPLVLTVELAKTHQGDDLVRKLTHRVVQRADEITELLACYAAANGRQELKQLNRLSKQLQKGLADAFNKFDEYQLAKYNRDAQIKLRDALFLVHPKAANEDQQTLFDKLAANSLPAPYTWEVELSALGQQGFDSAEAKKAAFKAKWEELIESRKLGYMAVLRNLRNILEAGVSNEALNKLCAYLRHPEAVKKSKQLPFRFLSAYRELKELSNGRVGLVLEALEDAVLCSAANIAGYDESTKLVIAADVSGSMQKAIGPRSKVQNFDVGLMLAMLLQSRCAHVVTGMFGDTWKVVQVPKKSVLANVMEFHRREGEVGYATNGYLVVQDLLHRQKVVDKIIVFTDCQLWNSRGSVQLADVWKRYKALAPGAKLYLFDLAGYGTAPLQVLRNDVFLIGGWSDKVFDVLAAIEKGGDALSVINKIEL